MFVACIHQSARPAQRSLLAAQSMFILLQCQPPPTVPQPFVAAHARYLRLLESAGHANEKHKLTHHYRRVKKVPKAMGKGPGALVSDPGALVSDPRVCCPHRRAPVPLLGLAGKGGGPGT